MHASRKLGNGSIMNTDSKGQVRCIQTLTVQVEGSLFETSKFSLYFSGSCIPINSKLSYIFEMAGKCVPKTRLRAKRRAFTIGNGWSYKVGNFTAFSLRQGKIMLSLNPRNCLWLFFYSFVKTILFPVFSIQASGRLTDLTAVTWRRFIFT
jgi:hypothetical protein